MSKLKANEIYTVAKALIGSVEPCGDTAFDDERLVNMETLIGVTDMLLDDIMKQSGDFQRPEASIRAIALKAREYLIDIGVETVTYGFCTYHEIECDYAGQCAECPHNTTKDKEWFKEDERRAE